MKKIWAFLIVGILCAGIVTSAWYFIFSSGLSVRIDSLGSQKDVTLSIPSINLNTSNSSDKGGASTSFMFNKAGTFIVDIIETQGDLSGGQCLDGDNDCQIVYTLWDGNSNRNITNKQNISLPANNYPKSIIANISCVAYSCPQTRDILIKLTQTS